MARTKGRVSAELIGCPWKDCPCYNANYQRIDPCDEGQLKVCRRIREELSVELSREEAQRNGE